MKLIKLIIKNPHGFDVKDQPVAKGIPLPAGTLWRAEDLTVVNNRNQTVPHAARILTYWADGSARWVLIEIMVCVDSGHLLTLDIQLSNNSRGHHDSAQIERDLASDSFSHLHLPFQIESAGISFSLDPEEEQVLATPGTGRASKCSEMRSSLEMVDVDGRKPELDLISQRWVRWQPDYSCVLETVGEIRWKSGVRAMRVTIEQTIFTRSALSRVEITLHNPSKSSHPGGIWDLGDSGSTRFRGCSLVLEVPTESSVMWKLNRTEQWQAVESEQLSIVQTSSGGENWDSPVHVDDRGRPTAIYPGYRVREQSRELAAGNRCEPALLVDSGAFQMTICPERFWQCFPKAMSVIGNVLRMEMFPAMENVEHELQGGESSTSVFYLSFGENCDTLDWVNHQLQVSLERAPVFLSRALSSWHVEQSDEKYLALLDRGLCGEQSFFKKRETVDEYGWRHFGELYADHETWNQSPAGIFVSHYNNQYDPVFGFGRQYLQTGDQRWFDLMSDLARHVLDIDLYRTEEDRPEYNQGLFWHTDHYVQAYTATHRSYSRHQQSDQHELTGGGPGGQHCYTSGLRLYYQLTGNARARQAVFDMTRWMGFVYEGTDSILERARVSLSVDLPVFLKLLRKEKVMRYRYTLDRGVGNYMQALLDCYELDGERHYLDRIGLIIRDTVGPVDNIEERDLGDIERTWHYTVFFQAVVAYLDTKRTNEEFDADFHYARNSLLHYAQWMLIHEAPYLHSAEKLEYANDTWVAQDTRKAAVLYAAYRYSFDDREAFFARAKFFKDYVISTLYDSDTLHYTRIQAILLQSHGPVGEKWEVSTPYSFEPVTEYDTQHAHTDFPSYARRFATAWLRCLRTFSIAREMAWVRHRVPRTRLSGRVS